MTFSNLSWFTLTAPRGSSISSSWTAGLGPAKQSLRTVIDSGWTEALDKNPKIQELPFEDIVKLMLAHFLEKHPLVSQRIGAMRITKEKDESISECMHRIHDSYLSAELDKCPLETLVLLHLLILLPQDPLSEKVKNWLVEAMRIEPNIKSLDKVSAYIQVQESDYITSKGAQDTKVNLVKPQDGDGKEREPKKDILCRICSKMHQKFKCSYK